MENRRGQLIVLDFDSTLFDVNLFLTDLTRVIKEECGITPEKFHETYESVKKSSGSYSIYDHLKILDVSDKDAERILTREYLNKDYACAGVCEAVKKFRRSSEVIIWTLGHPRFQKFKHSLIPCLAGIPFFANEASKTTFPKEVELHDTGAIYNGWEYTSIVLIDDRPRNFLPHPPQYMRQIRVKYPGDRYGDIPTPDGVEEVASLNDIEL